MADEPQPTEQPSLSANSGRLPNGRFGKGNRLGIGNPFRIRLHELRSALYAEVKDKDIVMIARKLISMSRKGNIHAIRELLDRLLGKPHQSLEVSAVDMREVQNMSDAELLDIVAEARKKNAEETE